MNGQGGAPPFLGAIAPFAGTITFLIEAAIVMILFRAMASFRSEVRKVDSLVAEYVRCRDYLLTIRQPTVEGGVRTAEGDAFREAWGNFNHHLEVIRDRYTRQVRGSAIALGILLALLIVVLAAWIIVPTGETGLSRWLTPVAAALSALLLWGAVLGAVGAQRSLIRVRTDGNYLIAPWPTDGGSGDRQLALMEKFLPVETLRPEGDSPVEAV